MCDTVHGAAREDEFATFRVAPMGIAIPTSPALLEAEEESGARAYPWRCRCGRVATETRAPQVGCPDCGYTSTFAAPEPEPEEGEPLERPDPPTDSTLDMVEDALERIEALEQLARDEAKQAKHVENRVEVLEKRVDRQDGVLKKWGKKMEEWARRYADWVDHRLSLRSTPEPDSEPEPEYEVAGLVRRDREEPEREHVLGCNEYHAHHAPKCCSSSCWCRKEPERDEGEEDAPLPEGWTDERLAEYAEQRAAVVEKDAEYTARLLRRLTARLRSRPSEDLRVASERHDEDRGTTDMFSPEIGDLEDVLASLRTKEGDDGPED